MGALPISHIWRVARSCAGSQLTVFNHPINRDKPMMFWAEISFWANSLVLFAEDEAEGGNPIMTFLPMILMIGFLYYFIIVRGNRREKNRRTQLMDSLKKNDRVVTIGGIIGTISSISQDGREVTLKIDDNSKMKILRTAIQGPLREKEEDGTLAADISKDNNPADNASS
jgi:preprotein translocase subunit YajC